MKFILLIAIYAYNAITSQQIEFKTKAECEEAAKKVKEFSRYWASAVCLETSK